MRWRGRAMLGLVAVALAACARTAPPAPPSAAIESQTYRNLHSALQGAVNATAHDAAFARMARADGYPQVARLFAAAAASAGVQARNTAAVLRALGGQATPTAEPANRRSTPKNLEVTLRGATYERDTMYPGFAATARAEQRPEAAELFARATLVQASHAELFTTACTQPGRWPRATITLLVCPTCGLLTVHPTLTRCPACGTSIRKFARF